MKKTLLIMLVFVCSIMLCGCNMKMLGMPKYIDEECHYGEGFQDYTDYCKYFYDENTIKEFETNDKFKVVTDSDIEDIKSYFENFGEVVKSESYYDKYDFDYQSQVKDGDYFYIVNKDGYEKLEYYDVYYVDMANNTLYFFHSNI